MKRKPWERQMARAQSKELNREDRERTILRAACKVIRKQGFHGARMADIAKEADVSYGLAYHYFESKDGVFEKIVEDWWRRLFDHLDVIEESSGGIREKLAKVFEFFLDQYQTQPDQVHIFTTELSRSSTNLTSEHLDRFKRFIGRVEGMIVQARKEGELRKELKPRYMTYVFLGGLETFISAMVLEGQPVSGEKMKRRLVDGLLDIFLNGAGG
jgi:TetR/AcrR family transcriptional regulator, fatty acid metabolism regulator protein